MSRPTADDDEDAIRDRAELERDYDRPSFHCGHPECLPAGRFQAIMDRHHRVAHRDLYAGGASFRWDKARCSLCGFDAAAELRRLFPEGTEP